MVLTARPEFVPPWPARSHITPITLNRLERPHAEALVARIAGAKPLPAEVVDHIVTKTDGVPLYVEELTKTILASDILRDAGDRFALTGPLSSLAIPDTLQESLMARLDRLPQVRELAQLASVLGREFAYEMISGLSTLGDTLLQEGLGQLVETELLYQRGRPPRARYIFKHALVQDAAYGSLLKRNRQQAHLQVAELLEAQFPDTVEAHPEILGHHYREANLSERAVRYFQAAGERDLRMSANTEAIAHLGKGLEIIATMPAGLGRDSLELDLLMTMGPALIATKGYAAAEVEPAYRRALALCVALDDWSKQFSVLLGLSLIHLVREDLLLSRELAEQAVRPRQASSGAGLRSGGGTRAGSGADHARRTGSGLVHAAAGLHLLRSRHPWQLRLSSRRLRFRRRRLEHEQLGRLSAGLPGSGQGTLRASPGAGARTRPSDQRGAGTVEWGDGRAGAGRRRGDARACFRRPGARRGKRLPAIHRLADRAAGRGAAAARRRSTRPLRNSGRGSSTIMQSARCCRSPTGPPFSRPPTAETGRSRRVWP